MKFEDRLRLATRLRKYVDVANYTEEEVKDYDERLDRSYRYYNAHHLASYAKFSTVYYYS